MRHAVLSVPVCLALFASSALAQWSDNFDSYPASATTPLAPQGGWEEWTTGASAFVTTAQFRSAPNSVAIGQLHAGASTLESDCVHQYHDPLNPGTYDHGAWVYSAWQYVPSTMTGTTYFIMMNTYAFPAGPYAWSVQVEFNAAAGTVQGDCGANNNWNVTLHPDQWVRIKVIIDLDHNKAQVFYGDEEPSPVYTWTGGVFGGGNGQAAIAAVDLYANNGTDAYYDDIELYPLVYEQIGGNPAGSHGQIQFTNVVPASASVGAWVTSYANLPAAAHVHILGLSNSTSPLLGALPVDFTPYGAPGHKLRVSNDGVLFGLGTPSGTSFTGQFSMSIPGGTAFVGLALYEQVAYLDPGLNALGGGLSPAYMTVIGQ